MHNALNVIKHNQSTNQPTCASVRVLVEINTIEGLIFKPDIPFFLSVSSD